MALAEDKTFCINCILIPLPTVGVPVLYLILFFEQNHISQTTQNYPNEQISPTDRQQQANGQVIV